MVMRVFDQIRVLDAELKQSDPRTIQYQVKLALRNQLRRRRALWTRALPLDSPDGDNAMVENWHRLVFLSDRDNTGKIFESGGFPYLVEVDRDERL
jgi:hypothetical protein